MKWGLFKEHIFPWFWKHSLLIGSGMISSGYQPKANVAFDEMPDLGPDFSGQSTKRPYLRVVENHQSMVDDVVRMAEADMHRTAEKLGLSG
jgi:hypothetical protein